MKLEDALLYLVLDGELRQPDKSADLARAAIAGGVDILRVPFPDEETVIAVADVCREDDAILLVTGTTLPAGTGVDGLHLERADDGMGAARLAVGMDGIVGVSSRSLDDARLALEVGADYLVHTGGVGCPAVFAALRGEAGVPLYAGGIGDLEDSQHIVEGGIYRLCLELSKCDGENLSDEMAMYSRLLGRSI